MKILGGVCFWLACLASAVRAQAAQPVVAIHDSELTRALETMSATNAGTGTPIGAGTTGYQWWPTNWHYFVMPDSIKEALRSDGTPFTVLGDSNITAGALLSNGVPNYPILISLASEAMRDDEIGPLTNYVAAGGTLLVGSSSFTRTTNGAGRGDFAIANAMGVHVANSNMANWTLNKTFSKLVNHPLVSHVPGGVLDWNLPVAADETAWGVSPLYNIAMGHFTWLVVSSNATVIAQGDTNPYLLTRSFGKGTIIYYAPMEAMITHGGNSPGMFAYGIFRNAIQTAFASANLPIAKVSPWPYPYDAALSVRHDLENLQSQITAIEASAQFEFTNGAKGDYYFCTGTLRVEMTNLPAVVASLGAAVTNFGATICPHNGGLPNSNNLFLVLSNYDFWHWAMDEGLDIAPSNVPSAYSNAAAYTFVSTSNSFMDVEGWLGNATNGYRLMVAPHFNATREASYQIEQALGVVATGEQKLSPFPSWVLSTSIQTPDLRYPFVSLPVSDWYVAPPVVAEAMESGYGVGTMHQCVDFYYNLGSLVNLYSHSSSAGNGLAGTLASQYVTYAMAKPRIWPANALGIYLWWVGRSNMQATATYSTNGNHSVVKISIKGATDSQSAVEVVAPGPSVASVQLLTNGVAAGTNSYRTNGPLIKVLVGHAITNAQVSYLLNPTVQSNFYTVPEATPLSVVAPGVLTNALAGVGTNLTAVLLSGPTNGVLHLTNNGGFTYTPSSNFVGIDSFTYLGTNNGVTTSASSRASIDVTPPGTVFFDNFIRPTNADPFAPWIAAQGNWSLGGGTLTGTDPDPGIYDDAYVPGNWTNFSVQGQVQIPANGFGAGLDGRVNPVNGARYTVVVYPAGIPGNTILPTLRLLKFHSWEVLGPAPMQQVTLPTVGTNWHTLQVVFHGNQILAYFDGALAINVVDTNFDGLAPFTSGGLGAHLFTYGAAYVASYRNLSVGVEPVAVNSAYTAVENQALRVAAPGVLANDTPCLGSSLTAVLLSSPTNGLLTLNLDGSFTYTPATNYIGPDAFSYQASDGLGTSAPATVMLNVLTNSAPVANADSYSYTPNTTLVVPAPGVLANDSDPNNASLSAILANPPTCGALTLNANGGFSYVPGTNFTGFDAFTYVANDGTLNSAPATVSLFDLGFGALYYENFGQATSGSPGPWAIQSGAWAVRNGVLQGGNDPLSSYGFVYLTNSWSDFSVQAQFQFPVESYGGGLGARLNPTNGAHYAAWIYPSGNNFNLLKFQNWSNATVLATANLAVIGTNAHTLMLAMEGSQVAVYYDGQMITSVADNSSPYLSGGVSLDMYTDTSAYQISIGDVAVEPLAGSDNYVMAEDTILTVAPAGVLGNDTGVYSTNLNALLISGPSNGALSLSTNGGFSYTPNAGFLGADTFTYQANDSQTNLGVATVTITVGATHTPPSLPAQTTNFTINDLETLVVTNTATQTVTPPLTLGYSLLDPPAGAVIDGNGIITWTPSQAQAPSTNLITTLVTDNGLPAQSSTNSFVVVVLDQNTAPVLPVQPTFTISGLTTLVVTNTATEANIHSLGLTYTFLTAPSNAVMDGNGIITFTPVLAQVPSTNAFTTVVSDEDPLAANAQELSATNSFTVIVNAIHNGPSLPFQANQALSLPATLLVTNLAIDTDVPPTLLTYRLINPPIGASIDNNGLITWTPVQAQAPSSNVLTTVVTDNGSPPLSATNSFAVTVSGMPLGAFYYENFAQATPGSVAPWVVEEGNWTVTNGMLQGGTDPGSTYGQIYLTNSWNDYSVEAPVAFAENGYGGGLGGRLNPATGARYAAWIYPGPRDVRLIRFSSWSATTFLAVANLTTVGTNAHNLKMAFRGNEIAVYLDGTLLMTYADATPLLSGGVTAEMYTGTFPYVLTLDSLLAAPLAVPYDYLMTANTNLTVQSPGVLANDTGVYGTNLSAVLVSGPLNGALTLSSNGGFAYTPNLGFSGQDSFEYQANDNQTNLGTALVTITVVPAPRNGPSLPAQPNRTVDELTTLLVTNTATDMDLPPPALGYQLVNPPAGASIDAHGIITWTPTQVQAPSTTTITTVVSDNGSPPLYATNKFDVVVNDLNSAPVLLALPDVSISGLTPLRVTNTASEFDIHALSLSYALTSAPTNALIDQAGIISWTPVPAQVPSTNVFTTVVTDYDPLAANAQQLSATNNFTVFVNATHNGPALLPHNDQTVYATATLVVTNTAVDNDVPALALTYTLVNPPTGANIDTNGIISWTPAQNQAPSTNTITTVVSDSGSPTLSATNNFSVIVLALPSPVLQSIVVQSGSVSLTWSAVSGHTYRVEYKTNLPDQNWTALTPDVLANGPSASVTNDVTGVQQRFYRVQLIP